MRSGKGPVRICICVLTVFILSAVAQAQMVPPNQFGIQDRADAARDSIVIAVQQGISSLPPTSGQAFTYDYDSEIGALVPTERLGPTSFRSPYTVARHKLSLRAAATYFQLGETFGPIPYGLVAADPSAGYSEYTKFGSQVSADVGLLNFAATYGVAERAEVMLNVPVVITDVSAYEISTVFPEEQHVPPCQAFVAGVTTLPLLNQNLADGNLKFRKVRFSSLASCGGVSFNDGTNAGVGRISVGGKLLLHASERFDLAFMGEFFAPSPNEDQFAGSDTPAILPRLVSQISFSDIFKGHVDAGYDFDFIEDELRRFTWNAGASAQLSRVTFDLGFGGSLFNEGVEWTPASATFEDVDGVQRTIVALGDNTLGTNFVDVLAGVKTRITDTIVISGAVNVPITNDGFRADAVGTLAVEGYF